jgi:hypothetical protein
MERYLTKAWLSLEREDKREPLVKGELLSPDFVEEPALQSRR